MFSKADNYMNDGCFLFASSCGKYPYIDDLYLKIFLILLYILLNTEATILVKILLDAIFSGIPMAESFLRERIHCENIRKSFVTLFLFALMFIYK